jgi:ubiquitin C-terminal hydrolase
MKGIPNFGNTCYFNSVLQCLLQVPDISNFFILNDYKGDCEFTQEYQKVVKSAWVTKADTFIDPRNLLKLFRNRFKQFDTTEPHDAQEALMCMLDMLEPVTKSFVECKLVQETVCPSGKTVCKDVTSVLSLAPMNTLEESLKQFSEWQSIDGYKDNTEKVWNVAVTRTVIESFPKIFILSLTQKKTIKVSERMGSLVLFASCVHAGSQNGGHYVSFTKHKGKWYLKDDLRCVESPFPEVSGHTILFYRFQNEANSRN